jgi:O-antigen/teichoic acid export membrane protein
VAAAVLVLNLIVLGLGSVPQSVLQGENLGYRRLGLSTAILALGALLTALALWAGWGLVGVAAATCVATALSGITYLHIVRSQVPWWGISRPAPHAVRGFLGISSWFLLWNLVMQAIKTSDVIVLGAFGGVALVTTYTLTSYVPQAVSDTVFMMISATMPGLAGLIGSGERDRAARIRGETLALCWLLATAAGAVVIAWLPWFVRLWVGEQYDAGTLTTVLIIAMVLQLALIRVDSNVIDLTLRIRGKVLLGLLSVALSAALGAVLVGPVGLGLPGLVAGFMAGRVPLSIAYPVLVGRLLGLGLRAQALAAIRPLAATVGLLTVAILLRGVVEAHSWFTLVPLGLVSTAASLLAAYLGGLPAHQRRRIRTRVRRVVGRA